MTPRARSLAAVVLVFGLVFACSGPDTIRQVVTITGVEGPGGAADADPTGGLAAASGTSGGSVSGGHAGNATAGTNGEAGAGNPAGSSGGVAGGSSGNGGETAVAGAGATSGAGGEASSPQSGGSAGAAGNANNGGEPSGLECSSDLECGIIDGACRQPICNAGQCGSVVDQNNVPFVVNPCMLGTCNKFGEAGKEPGPAGKACKGANGEKLCDAFGRCVQCLQSSDCTDGKVCGATRLCVTASCTDVDCGGICPPCDNGKKCEIDGDCASNACDDATHTCVANQCHDQRQNGDETDADCGGSTCPKCELLKSCIESSDCKSDACDFFTLQCVSWQCGDRRQDGVETDVDCGGPSCNSCFPGEACHNSLDCQSGHQCVQNVCK
jgi:hypothetical protein